MGAVKDFFNRKKTDGGMRHPINSFWDTFLRPLLSGTKFDYASKVGDGQDASVIMAPVMWIATNAVQALSNDSTGTNG